MKRLAIVLILGGCAGPEAPPVAAAKPPVLEAPKAAPVMEAPKPPPRPANPDLLVHLTLDGSCADASGHGNGGVLQGKAVWVDGKSGKGLAFDGSGGHVEIPSAPALDQVNQGSYTLSAWFKPADVPPGKEAENNASYSILNKVGWHEGLRYSNEKRFVFEHWLAGPKPEEPEWKGAGTWEAEYEPGAWHHVAGVVDRAAGATRIYVNGELVNSGEWDANAKARDYGKATWKVGTAAPGSQQWAWPAKGAIDDVRIYKRALTDAEVASLCKEGAK